MQELVVVITGASSGIGAAIAQASAKFGYKPVLAARRKNALDEVADRCGEEALCVVTDVTRRDEVERLRDAAIHHFGHIDVWINNAGRGINRQVSQITDEDFDEMMLVNVKSALYGMQAIVPHFQSRRQGHIINISSMLGRIPYASIRSAYSAAKHALTSLSTSLRLDLQTEFPEIHVSTVFPGVVATDFGNNAVGGGPDSRQMPNAQPVEELAQLVIDLIENPRAEVYSRPGYHDQVKAYFSASDVAELEAQPPFLPAAVARR